jgi:hypothetical protein
MVHVGRHAGRWGAYVAVGLTLALSAGVAQGQQQDAATHQGGKAPAHGQGQPSAAPSPPRISVYKPSCDTPPTREDAEYCQERKSAEAESESVKWSFWQFVASGIGVGAVVITLGFTIRAANAAAKAAGVADRALNELE